MTPELEASKLKHLDAQIAVLETELQILEAERRKLVREKTVRESPIKIGDILKWVTGGAYGRKPMQHRGRVCDVRKPYEKFEYAVVPLLKTGGDGQRVWLHSWHKVERE